MRPWVRRLSVLLLYGLTASCATGALRRQSTVAFEAGSYEEAIASLERAVKRDPSNVELRLQLGVRRAAAVQQLTTAGDRARSSGKGESAAKLYRRALSIEPGNDRALQSLDGLEADKRHAERTARAEQLFAAKKPDAAEVELRAVLAEDPGFAPASALLARIDFARGPASASPRLKTRDDRPVTLQFRDASVKMVFEALAKQTGLNFVLDRDVKSDTKATIFVNQMPVDQAVDVILAQNQLGRQVLSDNTVLIFPNTPAKQKDYREEIVHTFYLTNAAPKDAETMLKTVLGTKTLFTDEHSGTVVMRDTPERVRMAEKLVASLDVAAPEVVMEVEVLEISHSLAEQLGINFPSSVSLSLTKPGAAAAAAGLVVGDLGRQNKNTIAVSSLGVSIDLLKTVGASNVLSSPRIRARNKEKAKILVGNRLPVVTSGTSATVGGAFSTSNVQYIDVGLTLEVQPTIHNDGDVAIKLSLEVSSILKQINVPIGNGGTTLAYEIGTRSASTLLELRDGETQVLAGLIQRSEQDNSSHVPGLGDLPILGRLFGSDGKTRDKNEVILSITPRIVRSQPRPPSETSEFWFGTETQSRSAPFGSEPFAAGPTTPGGPVVPGVVSAAGGAAPNAPGAPAPGAPRALPARIQAAAGRPDAGGAEGPAEGAAPDTGPRVTIEGPDTAKTGDEVGVTVRLSSSTALGRIRAQVGYDAAALQLLAAEPGDLTSSGAPKIDVRQGGVQLELAGGEGAPLSGGGSLVNLRFRVVATRTPLTITTQVVLVGEDGVAVAATQATPLSIGLVQ